MTDKPRAAIHVGAPAKSFSAAEGFEPERRGWDEKTYRLKNQDANNHYDFTRKHLNFEINRRRELVSLGSNPTPLHERLQQRLNELDFKTYKDKNNPSGISDNSPNCTVGIVVSGDHDVLTRLAFGNQEVDFSLQKNNAHVKLQQGIKDWALDTYDWACRRWGAENIIGFDVHCDEKTPHIHIQTVPVARTKARGRASVKYVHKEDADKVLSSTEWKKLPETERNDYIKTEVERREKECVSYALVWGENKYAVGRTYYEIHTDYHNEVGKKYGLERGEDIATLPEEEQRERVHKNKRVLEAERQAKEAIKRMEAAAQQTEKRKSSVEKEISTLEAYAKAANVRQEDLLVPSLNTNPLVNEANKAIQAELDKPIPSLVGQKEWRKERKKAVKQILTDMQTKLLQANEVQKQDILKLGKSLYLQAMKDVQAIIEQNRQLLRANERLTAENAGLKERISKTDENAVNALRKRKDAAVKTLHSEQARADAAESKLRDMLAIPEIKELWDSVQRDKRAFSQQIEQWINDAMVAVSSFAKDYENSDFSQEEGNAIGMGIIAIAFKNSLDPTDEKQRKKATRLLLDKVSWTGTTPFMSKLAETRTEQLSEGMNVPKELMANLLLAATGRGCIGIGGGGSDNELTNWDGTRKRSGWGR